jgi:transposase-like protein
MPATIGSPRWAARARPAWDGARVSPSPDRITNVSDDRQGQDLSQRSPYPIEFRQSAVARVVALQDAGHPHPFATIAQDLGVNPSTLRGWYHYLTLRETPDTGRLTAASGPVRRLSFVGLLRHARCGTLLRLCHRPTRGSVYICPHCHWLLDAEALNQNTVAAIAGCAPRLAATPHPDQWLLGLRVDDRCHIVSLRWRPTPASGKL